MKANRRPTLLRGFSVLIASGLLFESISCPKGQRERREQDDPNGSVRL